MFFGLYFLQYGNFVGKSYHFDKIPPVTFFLLAILSTFVPIIKEVDNTLTLNERSVRAQYGK